MAGFANRLTGGFDNHCNASDIRIAVTSSTTCTVRVPVREVADNVFDHYHGAVHDHAEIKRAQGEEVCWDLAQIEPNRRKQQ